MKSIKIYHYDAFGNEPNKGNPAGIVLDGDTLTESDMQLIAQKVGFSETAFPIKSTVADIRIRYFKPGHEMSLCGHATIATVYALKEQGLLGDKTHITIETKAGILPIGIIKTSTGDTQIVMQQASPQFKPYRGSLDELAKSMSLTVADIDDTLPTVYGSTGTWTLLVPIKTLEAFEKMKPQHELFPTVLKEMPKESIHPFCLKTYNQDADMHARHFPSPTSGTIEDPVTGTASGVMGAYFAKYIQPNFENSLNLVVEQGQEINKDGRVLVNVSKTKDNYAIKITGNAIYVKEFDILIGE